MKWTIKYRCNYSDTQLSKFAYIHSHNVLFKRKINSTTYIQITHYVAHLTIHLTSRGGQMSRVPASPSGRFGNPKIAGLSLEPTGFIPGRVKPDLILVIS